MNVPVTGLDFTGRYSAPANDLKLSLTVAGILQHLTLLSTDVKYEKLRGK